MSVRAASEMLTASMLAYFLLTNHVRLGRLNNLSHPMAQWRSTAVGLLPGALVLAGVASGKRLAIVLGACWLWLWFALQVRQWWIPYLFGRTPFHRNFRWYAEGGYHRTLSLLPIKGERPRPDLQHLLLQILTLSAAVLTTLAA